VLKEGIDYKQPNNQTQRKAIMANLKKDLQAVTKEFKTLTKRTKELTNKLKKTAVGQLEEAQAVMKVKSPAQHAADALKILTKQMEKSIKAVDKFEKAKVAAKRKPKAKPKTTKKAPAKKKTVAKKKAPAKKKAAKLTATDQVLKIIKRSRKGVSTATLMKKTGLADKTVRNILFRLSKQGKIKRSGRGVYVAA
jgi:predicted Rossmann fold nucleotide-binding protein DprA/Smf involved in DNA uptake